MYSILNLIMLRKAQTAHCIIAYISSVTITGVRPSIRFLAPRPSLPLPINFVHDNLFFNKIIYSLLFQGQVRLIQFPGRALRLGQARGPSAAGRTGKRPSAAARKGQGAVRCGHEVNYIHVLHIRSMYIIDRRGKWGVQKSYTRKLPITVKYSEVQT